MTLLQKFATTLLVLVLQFVTSLQVWFENFFATQSVGVLSVKTKRLFSVEATTHKSYVTQI